MIDKMAVSRWIIGCAPCLGPSNIVTTFARLAEGGHGSKNHAHDIEICTIRELSNQ